MAEAWQSAWVEVLPDFKNFRTKANSEMSGILGNAGTAGGVVAGQNMSGGILGGIKSLGGPILGAIAALGIGQAIGNAIGTGITYTLDSIDLASGLEEQKNAVKVAFGEISDEILALSVQAPKQLNLTQTAFAKLSVRFSDFAKKIAGPGGDVAAVIDELTTRGADFASVYDLDVADALRLFQSGLAGETEPLRLYGKDLSAAAVNAYALSAGISDGTRELTEAEKVQARYGLLLAQTAEVQGDLANTADSYANLSRKFAVNLEEAQTKFGEAILPTAIDLITFANDELVPILTEALAEAGPALKTAIEDVLPEIKALISTAAENLPGAIKTVFDGLEAVSKGLDPNEAPAAALNETSNALDNAGIAVYEWRQQWTAGYLEITEAGLVWVTAQQHMFDLLNAANETASDEIKSHWLTSIDETVTELNQRGVDWVGVGQHYGDGLAEGFRSRVSTVREAAALLAGEAIYTARNVMGIKSPSTVMREIGRYAAEGFTLGIAAGTPQAAAAMSSLVKPPNSVVPEMQLSADGASSMAYPPRMLRLLEQIAEKDTSLYADGVLVASVDQSGSAKLAAMGAN